MDAKIRAKCLLGAHCLLWRLESLVKTVMHQQVLPDCIWNQLAKQSFSCWANFAILDFFFWNTKFAAALDWPRGLKCWLAQKRKKRRSCRKSWFKVNPSERNKPLSGTCSSRVSFYIEKLICWDLKQKTAAYNEPHHIFGEETAWCRPPFTTQ